jgi:putative cell wall-binding protein
VKATLGAYGTVTRLSGSDRYATSVAVSKQVFPSADVAFIATGANFPDALGAAAAAGHLGAPVLLVSDRVPASVAAELQRLGPDTIYVVGGTSVISPSVANQLAAYGTVHRVAGNDRYGTAVQVSKLAHPNANLVDTVFIATGANFPDALGAAAAAGHLGAPVLLVGDVVPPSAVSELGRLDPDMTYVVGGPAVVSDWVLTQL